MRSFVGKYSDTNLFNTDIDRVRKGSLPHSVSLPGKAAGSGKESAELFWLGEHQTAIRRRHELFPRGRQLSRFIPAGAPDQSSVIPVLRVYHFIRWGLNIRI